MIFDFQKRFGVLIVKEVGVSHSNMPRSGDIRLWYPNGLKQKMEPEQKCENGKAINLGSFATLFQAESRVEAMIWRAII